MKVRFWAVIKTNRSSRGTPLYIPNKWMDFEKLNTGT